MSIGSAIGGFTGAVTYAVVGGAGLAVGGTAVALGLGSYVVGGAIAGHSVESSLDLLLGGKQKKSKKKKRKK